jgi:hypothetical protein
MNGVIVIRGCCRSLMQIGHTKNSSNPHVRQMAAKRSAQTVRVVWNALSACLNRTKIALGMSGLDVRVRRCFRNSSKIFIDFDLAMRDSGVHGTPSRCGCGLVRCPSRRVAKKTCTVNFRRTLAVQKRFDPRAGSRAATINHTSLSGAWFD